MPHVNGYWKAGDWIWSPNGTESEWCEIVSVASTSSWQFYRPSTGVVAAGPKALDQYKPDHTRPRELPPPKPS